MSYAIKGKWSNAVLFSIRTDEIDWTRLAFIVFGLWTFDKLIRASPGNNDELSGVFCYLKGETGANILWKAEFSKAPII